MAFSLEDFVRESNRIEGILRDPLPAEIDAHFLLLGYVKPQIEDFEVFVDRVQPGAKLRQWPGLDVRVGNHVAPCGGPEIKVAMGTLLANARFGDRGRAHQTHLEYETLHPFTDGNGRSGRALWLWQMGGVDVGRAAPLGFLHHFYYQTLDALR